jgi:hypothetical protein
MNYEDVKERILNILVALILCSCFFFCAISQHGTVIILTLQAPFMSSGKPEQTMSVVGPSP